MNGADNPSGSLRSPPPFTQERLGVMGRGERVREICLPRKEAANLKVFAHPPHSSPPLRGKELERRRWRKQRQFLGERQEQCERASEAVRHWSDKGKTGVVVRPSRSSARAIKMPPQATFRAHLRAVRICFSANAEKQYSYPAQPSVGGLGVLPERVLHLGTPTGRTTRWGKEERRSVGGLSIP